jgi:hypothetical protein
VQRNLMFLVPCAYASAIPAPGLHPAPHRVHGERLAALHGKLQIEDYGAEAMSLKRVLERRAGNLDSFARGMSYLPEARA